MSYQKILDYLQLLGNMSRSSRTEMSYPKTLDLLTSCPKWPNLIGQKCPTFGDFGVKVMVYPIHPNPLIIKGLADFGPVFGTEIAIMVYGKGSKPEPARA